jgi:hypothetical protein
MMRAIDLLLSMFLVRMLLKSQAQNQHKSVKQPAWGYWQ